MLASMIYSFLAKLASISALCDSKYFAIISMNPDCLLDIISLILCGSEPPKLILTAKLILLLVAVIGVT